MNSAMRSALRSTLFTLVVTVAGLAHAQISAPATSRLDTFAQSPEAFGLVIYRGNTFAQTEASTEPLFRYERRVATTASGLSAAHATRDLKGNLLIVESAVTTADYGLIRLDIVNHQVGYRGSVRVENNGRRLAYLLHDNGKASTATEDVTDPVVSGPSMFGFILKNWDVLKTGVLMPVRVIVLKDKTSYGFDIRMEQPTNGQTVFSVTPNSFLIRLAVAPLKVVFDTATKTAIRYEGRVPPMQSVAGKLKDLDARVEYTSVASAYR